MKIWIALIGLLLVVHGGIHLKNLSTDPQVLSSYQADDDDDGNLFFSGHGDDDDDHGQGGGFQPNLKIKVAKRDKFRVNVRTFRKYTKGARHNRRYTSQLEINSNVDYTVRLSATDFTDGMGNTLDPDNFGYYIENKGQHKLGTNLLLMGQSQSPSQMALINQDTKVIAPSGFGNKGNRNMNRFDLTFELGTDPVRALSGMPELMAQHIAPGVYSGTITLHIEPAN